MVKARSVPRFFPSMQGHTIMEVTVLLLLTIPMTTATPVRYSRRKSTESISLMKSIQRTRDVTLVDIVRESPSVDTNTKTMGKLNPDAASTLLLQTIIKKSRRRRAAQRGCQLGTCQVHNLVNKLYQMGQSNGKDESKKAKDPQGYGR